MPGWLVGSAVSIDTFHLHRGLVVQQPPSRRAPPTLDRRALFPHEPAISQGCGWSQELPGHTDQQPLAVCTLPRSADKRARAQTRGQDVRLRRQVGKSWRRSKRQSAFCLEAGHPPHLAARARCHPDALRPGSEGVSPLPSCELVEGTTIRSCFSACQRCQRHRSGGPRIAL